MERKLNAELWDKMHYLFRDYNDRMVHVELHYDFRINIDALKTVLTCFFEKAPVLHSSFTDNHIHPYWTVKDYHINDILTVKDFTVCTIRVHHIRRHVCACGDTVIIVSGIGTGHKVHCRTGECVVAIG